MLLAKLLVVATAMFTLAGASVGTGVLFGAYLIAAGKNPEEAESLFNAALMAFALIETFVFMAFLVAGLVFFLV